ncbi:T9SS-dependent choice-of-anchor J family protein [Tenuifilum thalassicum]|uniref:Choice-of-anchor D domain-containing protein n=1 Tax=Tenuifilum thalassicum TaxID=2590900 RepID=A0A7D3XLT0_9BACT|nr:choice-of-anchor J domain-containing protein [Tenuifilum thalassicum]QKG80590.1 choice-of-anchor D domain-containing protein [Tenuifilum thalassicum]
MRRTDLKEKSLWIILVGISLLALSYVSKGQTILYEGFDSEIPASWTVSAESGSVLWNYATTGGNPSTTPKKGGGMVRYNCYNATAGSASLLQSPELTFPNGSTSVKLEFWMYRDNGFSSSDDLLEVYISNTTDYTTGDKLGEIHRNISKEPTVAANGWYLYSFPIPSSYLSSTAYLTFKGISAYGNNIFVDEVKVFSPFANDLKVESVTSNSMVPRNDEVITFTAKVINVGADTQNNIALSFEIDGNAIGQETITSIAPGDTAIISKDWTATEGNHTLLVQLPADDDVANNSYSDNFTVYGPNSLVENFENEWPPMGWESNGWTQGSFGAFEGSKCAYISSSPGKRLVTPKLDIDAGSSLSFYAKVGYGSKTFKLQYSTDKQTWQDIANSDVELNNEYKKFTIPLNSLTPGQYYLAFDYEFSYTSVYIDLVAGPNLVVEAPNAATNPSPTDGATEQQVLTTLSWDASSQGGIPTGYKVYIGTDGGGTSTPTNFVNGELVNSTSYTVQSALNYSTTYYWQIVPTNSQGDAANCPIWSFTTMADPTQPIPYSVDFNDGVIPNSWIVDKFSVQDKGKDNSKSLSVDLSYISDASFSTCPVGPLNASTQLVFDYRICKPSFVGYPQEAYELTADDKIEVLVSDDAGNSFTNIYEINSSNHYNSLEFKTIYLNLNSSYNGKSLIFRLGAHTGGGDFVVDIDNFMVRETPTNPSLGVNRTLIDFGYLPVTENPVDSIIVTNTGGGVLQINESDVEVVGTNSSSFTILADFPIELTAGMSSVIKVKFSDSQSGVKEASLNVASNASQTPSVINLNAESYSPLTTFFEDFESTDADKVPKGWTANYSGYGYAGVEMNANNAYSGSKTMQLSKWSNSLAYVITPALADFSENRLVFYAKSSLESTAVAVGVVSNPKNLDSFDEIALVNLTTEYKKYSVDFSSYAGTSCYIAFKTPTGASNPVIRIDDVNWEKLPTTPILAVSKSSLYFGLAVVGDTLYSVISLSNQGADTILIEKSNLSFIGADSLEFLLADSIDFPISIGSNQSKDLELRFVPQTEGEKHAQLQISHNGSNSPYNIQLTGSALSDRNLIEDFNSILFPPTGWSNDDGWVRQTFAPYEGVGHAYISPANEVVDTKLITPRVVLNDGDSIVFYHKTTAYSDFPQLKVMYSTTPAGPWSQVGDVVNVNTYSYTKSRVNFTGVTLGTYYVALAVTSKPYKSTFVDYVYGPVVYTEPKFTSSPDSIAYKGEEYRYNVSVVDKDGQNISITSSNIPSWLTLNDNGDGTAVLVGVPSVLGDNTIVLEASDGVSTVNQEFVISVVESNHLPVFSSTPLTEATVGESYEYQIIASDEDNDALTFQLVEAPTWLSLTDNGDGTAVLNGIPTAPDTASVKVQVSDGKGSTTQSFEIEVKQANVAPTFITEPKVKVQVNGYYNYSIKVSDANGDPITIKANKKPGWMSFIDNGNGTAVLSGLAFNEGVYDVELEASDGVLSTKQTFTVKVYTNHAPTFTSVPVELGLVNAEYEYQIVVSDENDDNVSLSVSEKPDWLEFTDNGDNTASLKGTPTSSGSFNVVISATDGVVSSIQQFTIHVKESNYTPTFTSSPVLKDKVGVLYSYSITVTDSDNDKLYISANSLPSWLSLTDNGDGTALLEGTPSEAGTYSVVLVASDLIDDATQQFDIEVGAANNPPVIESTPILSATVNEQYTYDIVARDQDGDPLEFNAVTLPDWLKLDVKENGHATLSGTPVTSGRFDVEFEVTDGYESTNQSFTINVVVSGIEDEEMFSIEVFPNPTSSFISVSGVSNVELVEIFNVLGNRVIVVDYTQKIDISKLPKGLYLIRVKNRDRRVFCSRFEVIR